ncbi:hypothetical protein, partial [Vibrio fluvialis]|uniref:hypothetical protein n=1 Tax=Vibrio fluvialis TaxID=676 RepID=UPI00192AC5F9
VTTIWVTGLAVLAISLLSGAWGVVASDFIQTLVGEGREGEGERGEREGGGGKRERGKKGKGGGRRGKERK